MGVRSTHCSPASAPGEANLAAEGLSRATAVHEAGILELVTQRGARGSFAHLLSSADCVRYLAVKAGVQAGWRRAFGAHVRDSELRPAPSRQPKAVAVHRSAERTRFP